MRLRLPATLLQKYYLYGINPVMSAIYSKKRQLHQIMVAEKPTAETNSRLQNIINYAYTEKLPVKFVPKAKLEKFCQHQPHQGVVLKCQSKKYFRIDSPEQLFEEAEDKKEKLQGKLVLFLDQITDPQNFGAALRCGFYLGCDAFVVNEESRCTLTPTVSKTSAGALEFIDMYCVKEIDLFFERMKVSGWKIVGASLDKKDSRTKELDDYKLTPQDNVIVVLGSESKGISHQILQHATDLVYINTGIPKDKYVFPYTLLDSLNVSVAAGIILRKFRHLMQ